MQDRETCKMFDSKLWFVFTRLFYTMFGPFSRNKICQFFQVNNSLFFYFSANFVNQTGVVWLDFLDAINPDIAVSPRSALLHFLFH